MKNIFKPYRNDTQMEADAKHNKRKRKMKDKEASNKLSDQIFRAVVDQIDGGVESFTKEEMIRLVAGEVALNQGEWLIWHKACTTAIQRIRRHYWSDNENVTVKKMFNFIRHEQKYYLVKIDDKLGTNVVYDAYDKKIKGIAKRMRQIGVSAYQKVLELDDDSREDLIKKLKEQKLLNNK